MNIKNVISIKILETRFKLLCKDNWKVKNIYRDSFNNEEDIDSSNRNIKREPLIKHTIKFAIDNWPTSVREEFLKLLNLKENKDFVGIYHNLINIPIENVNLNDLGYAQPGKFKHYIKIELLEAFLNKDRSKYTIEDFYFKDQTIYKGKDNIVSIKAKSYRTRPEPYVYIDINLKTTGNNVALENVILTDKFLDELETANMFMKTLIEQNNKLC
jgi:hypothetical protein